MIQHNPNKYWNPESPVQVDRIELDTEDGKKVHWVNTETGELYGEVKFLDREETYPEPSVNMNYVQSRNLTELENLCHFSRIDSDSGRGYSVTIDGKFTDLVANGDIPQNISQRFLRLAKRVQRRNIFATTTLELRELLGTDAKNLSREIGKYIGLFRVHSPLGKKGESRMVEFNPLLVWKGDDRVRDLAIEAHW